MRIRISLLAIAGCIAMTTIDIAPRLAHAAPTTAPSTFLIGADISSLTQVEQRGGIFRYNNQPQDPIQLMAHHGWNCFRLRLFVNPDGRGGAINSLPYTIALAHRIKSAGASFILDIHYSDTWADPQHQLKPAAWKDLQFDSLVTRLGQYTTDVMHQMQDAGVAPDIVQVGNEITGGTLWPDAQVKVPPSAVKVYDGEVRPISPPQPYDDARQWDHLLRVLKAGIAAVRSAGPATQVLIHIDCGGDAPVTRWYCDHLQQAAVDYDILGQSYYPNWHGTLANLQDNLRQTAQRYHKKILVVETAYPWKYANYWQTRKNMAWPISPAGQKQFLTDLIQAVRSTPDDCGLGVIYWNPESISVRRAGSSNWQGGAMALFDDDGNALPALDILRP